MLTLLAILVIGTAALLCRSLVLMWHARRAGLGFMAALAFAFGPHSAVLAAQMAGDGSPPLGGGPEEAPEPRGGGCLDTGGSCGFDAGGHSDFGAGGDGGAW
jgi:hypothetical protein